MIPKLQVGFWKRHLNAPWRIFRRAGLKALISPVQKFECNLCGYKGGFVPHGFGLLQCPSCKSSNRHRLIVWMLETEMPDLLSGARRVLHFAPELSLGGVLRGVPGLRYETADLAAKGVDHTFDLQTERLSEDSYDAVMANHILEHIPDDRAALRNIFHMVKPGGAAIVTVPMRANSETTDEDLSVTDPAERTRRWGQPDHLRLYGKDLAMRMTEAGFAATIWTPPAGAPVQRFAMMGEAIFLGRKPL